MLRVISPASFVVGLTHTFGRSFWNRACSRCRRLLDGVGSCPVLHVDVASGIVGPGGSGGRLPGPTGMVLPVPVPVSGIPLGFQSGGGVWRDLYSHALDGDHIPDAIYWTGTIGTLFQSCIPGGAVGRCRRPDGHDDP